MPTEAAACPTCDTAKKKKEKEEKEKRDAKVAKMTEKLDPKLKEDVAKSPSLQRDLADLQDKGWKVETGDGDGAGGTNSATKTIRLTDGADTSTLAHEVQHAENFENGRFQTPEFGTMSRSEYVNAATSASIADERSAFDNQNLVKGEILGNGGRYIGQDRVFDARYDAKYTAYYNNAYGLDYDRYAPKR